MSKYQLFRIVDLKMCNQHIEKMGNFWCIQQNIQTNLQYSTEKDWNSIFIICYWGIYISFWIRCICWKQSRFEVGHTGNIPCKLIPHTQQHSFVVALHMTQELDPTGIFTGSSWYNELGLTDVPFNSVNSNSVNVSRLPYAVSFVYEVLSAGSDDCNVSPTWR